MQTSLSDDIKIKNDALNEIIFKLEQEVTKVSNYKEIIDSNKLFVVNQLEFSQKQQLEIRGDLENEKLKSLEEFQRVQIDMQKLEYQLQSLPGKVGECQAKVKNNEMMTLKMRESVD